MCRHNIDSSLELGAFFVLEQFKGQCEVSSQQNRPLKVIRPKDWTENDGKSSQRKTMKDLQKAWRMTAEDHFKHAKKLCEANITTTHYSTSFVAVFNPGAQIDFILGILKQQSNHLNSKQNKNRLIGVMERIPWSYIIAGSPVLFHFLRMHQTVGSHYLCD